MRFARFSRATGARKRNAATCWLHRVRPCPTTGVNLTRYGGNGIKASPACWMPKDFKLPAFDAQRVPSNAFDDVVKQVMEALPGEV